MTETRPFLDFKSIKARASISSILDRYGVKLNRVNQATLKGNCPLPSHSSQSKNTFYVSEAKSAWDCHSDYCPKNARARRGTMRCFPKPAVRQVTTRQTAREPNSGPTPLPGTRLRRRPTRATSRL